MRRSCRSRVARRLLRLSWDCAAGFARHAFVAVAVILRREELGVVRRMHPRLCLRAALPHLEPQLEATQTRGRARALSCACAGISSARRLRPYTSRALRAESL